ncbi:MAG TPA: hypothetical protein VFM37_14470, partial [Pseudonocardiaceae bacterium]|nr:hypothetical protein [Pseudonocardiaceae bacterium]
MIKQPQSSRLVSTVYNVAYKTGMTPWDSGGRMPEVTALVEGPDALPPGRMVDLGCGRGGYA